MSRLSSPVTFFVPWSHRSAPITHLASNMEFPASINPAFFRPSHCPRLSWGSVRGEKMRHPTAPDVIQRRRYGSNDLTGGFLWVLGSPQRPSIRASRDSGQSLFTACARRRSGEARTGAHPSDTRVPKKTRTVYGGSYQVTRSRPHESSQDVKALRQLVNKKVLPSGPAYPARFSAGVASSGAVSRPFFQVTISAPAGTSPLSRKRHKATNNLRASATMPIRRCRLLPLAKRF
jgi:hypothetical protein